MIERYVIYGLLGLNLEVLWTGATSLFGSDANLMGHTSIWMFFIYGTAVFLLEPVYKKINTLQWYIRGAIWVAVIFVIEFAAGIILKAVGVTAWEYTNQFSFMGLIRFDFAPLWFITGLIFEAVYSMLLKYNIGIQTGKEDNGL